METPTFLYKPNFCAECGEKIERESWHFWHSRRFCAECEPVFRTVRIVPPAMLAAIVLFTGIFLGNAGQKYDRIQAGTEQPASLAAKKELKPQTLIPQPVNTARDIPPPAALTPEPANTLKAAKPPAVILKAPEPKVETIYTCGARTQKGTPCSRRVKGPGRCWQHAGKPSMLEAPKY